MELRTTAEERELIGRAVRASGTDLTDFVITHATKAARRLLADRDHFHLDPSALKRWGRRQRAASRDPPGLRRLMQRRSPFGE